MIVRLWHWFTTGRYHEMSSLEFWMQRESRRIGDPYGHGTGR